MTNDEDAPAALKRIKETIGDGPAFWEDISLLVTKDDIKFLLRRAEISLLEETHELET